ncbi:MAG: hypothetical protein ABR575_03585 [Actinomycetota bacterium]
MKRHLIGMILSTLMATSMASPAIANHPHDKRVQGPNCGGKFKNAAECSFKYEGGQLYLGGSIRGQAPSSAAATIRLEARSQITGLRYLLLSCTYAGGGCAAGGSYETLEHVKKGQQLYCTAEGLGLGIYECGTLVRKRDQ